MATRREVLAAAAATVTLPLLQSALGTLRTANAQTAPAGRGAPAPDEKAGWITTKIKPADVKDGEFTDVPEHVIALARKDKDISAVTTKCTHKGCKIPPKAGTTTLKCPCHGGTFNLDGTVAGGPPKTPLAHYAIRVNADGFIEIDPGTKPKSDDKEYKISVA